MGFQRGADRFATEKPFNNLPYSARLGLRRSNGLVEPSRRPTSAQPGDDVDMVIFRRLDAGAVSSAMRRRDVEIYIPVGREGVAGIVVMAGCPTPHRGRMAACPSPR